MPRSFRSVHRIRSAMVSLLARTLACILLCTVATAASSDPSFVSYGWLDDGWVDYGAYESSDWYYDESIDYGASDPSSDWYYDESLDYGASDPSFEWGGNPDATLDDPVFFEDTSVDYADWWLDDGSVDYGAVAGTAPPVDEGVVFDPTAGLEDRFTYPVYDEGSVEIGAVAGTWPPVVDDGVVFNPTTGQDDPATTWGDCAVAEQPYAPYTTVTPQAPTSAEHAVLYLVNLERAKLNLDPLCWDDHLAGAARAHSQDWNGQTRTPLSPPPSGSYYHHSHWDSRDGLAWPPHRIKASGYRGESAPRPENTYEGGGATPAAAVDWWMNHPPDADGSQEHRAAILDPAATHAGVGVYLDGSGKAAFTLNFGAAHPDTTVDYPVEPDTAVDRGVVFDPTTGLEDRFTYPVYEGSVEYGAVVGTGEPEPTGDLGFVFDPTAGLEGRFTYPVDDEGSEEWGVVFDPTTGQPVWLNWRAVLGIDDYPYSFQACADAGNDTGNAAVETQCLAGNDPRGFTKRQCVSFVAWRLWQRGIDLTGQDFGDAYHWEAVAQQNGITLDEVPAVGAVAHWRQNEASPDGTSTAGAKGHVAYVTEVRADGFVKFEEYNNTSVAPEGYHHQEKWVMAPRYIHF